MPHTSKKEHIVIIGSGFAGLKLLNCLDKRKFRITIIDCNNYHSFPPLFYQIASAGIEPAGICFPVRAEIRRFTNEGVRFKMMRVKTINSSSKYISDGKDKIWYDKLVIAAGTTNNFFGISGLENSVYTLKSTPEAIRLRNDILALLEQASLESDSEKRKEMLRFVVVGGGPTGVETAGALGEMKRYILKRQYPDIHPDEVSVKLVEGNHRLLGTMTEKSSEQAEKYLKELGVEVFTGVRMKSYSDNNIVTDKGNIPATMLIWTAGITSTSFSYEGATPEFSRGHRIAVNSFNAVVGMNDVYAIGDIAISISDPAYPDGHPQLAQVAIQQAANLAANLNFQPGKLMKAFRYKDRGSMATVGRNRAVADLPKLHLGGFSAWVLWMFIHLISILGTRNKISVLINWSWGYFTYGSSLRMLFKIAEKPN